MIARSNLPDGTPVVRLSDAIDPTNAAEDPPEPEVVELARFVASLDRPGAICGGVVPGTILNIVDSISNRKVTP